MTQHIDLKDLNKEEEKLSLTKDSQPANGSDPLGATNPDDRVTQILALTEQLSTLLETENEFLKQRQMIKLTTNEAQKSKLSKLYALEMRAIAARPELLAGITDEQRASLRTAATGFRALTADHARRLARAKAVTEGLVKAIGDEVAKSRQPSKSYSPAGHRKITGSYARPAALSLDQSV